MSYAISYQRQAFRLPAAQAGHYEDVLFLVEKVGSNNCWEIGRRRRARSWQCSAVGSDLDCLQDITRMAAACCGGSLTLYGRRRTEPELYIRAWRRALAAARPYTEAGAQGFRIKLFVRISDAGAADGRKEAFNCLCSQKLVPRTRGEHGGVEVWDWRFDAAVPEQVRLWRETRGPGLAWQSVEVWGPRD